MEVGGPIRAVSTARLANGSRGGKDAIPMLTPPPPIEPCLEEQGGGVAERGEGRGRRGQVELAQERAVVRKTFRRVDGAIPTQPNHADNKVSLTLQGV